MLPSHKIWKQHNFILYFFLLLLVHIFFIWGIFVWKIINNNMNNKWLEIKERKKYIRRVVINKIILYSNFFFSFFCSSIRKNRIIFKRGWYRLLYTQPKKIFFSFLIYYSQSFRQIIKQETKKLFHIHILTKQPKKNLCT